MATFVAADGPALTTVIVNVTVEPTVGVGLSTVFWTWMSATAGGPLMIAVPELFDEFGSVWFSFVFVAVFEIVPACVTVTTIARVWDVPTGRPPSVQTPVAELYEPWDGVAETNVRPDGRTSVISTPVASLGPRSEAVIV